ncbi:MAG TPA: helix-turn-helix domain-containing GNAT family N-acetyltransferase [Blastocatellia bacterium]|nr:helix-turn-helix domain-containing GNAT family N-acetyltransferase [Blastocatellia bacterium]
MMEEQDRERTIQSIRRFNRFYTKQIGILESSYLQSSFSLTQVRVLYELAHCDSTTATELAKGIGLDAGYLSRILADFEKRGFINKNQSEKDGRQTILSLTDQGQKAFAPLDIGANEQIGVMVGKLSSGEQNRLLEAMSSIQQILGEETKDKSYVLRPHRPGDLGWVIHRHGVLYAQEYGYEERFEALVAEIAAKFIQKYDPKRERCWIAERSGENVGSVFLVKSTEDTAKLRLLIVEPSARGLGIGKRLVDECIRFARQAGYKKITLWTHKQLHAAISIYKKAGFHLVNEEPDPDHGIGTISQVWELVL